MKRPGAPRALPLYPARARQLIFVVRNTIAPPLRPMGIFSSQCIHFCAFKKYPRTPTAPAPAETAEAGNARHRVWNGPSMGRETSLGSQGQRWVRRDSSWLRNKRQGPVTVRSLSACSEPLAPAREPRGGWGWNDAQCGNMIQLMEATARLTASD